MTIYRRELIDGKWVSKDSRGRERFRREIDNGNKKEETKVKEPETEK